jgi:3-dehydroquinate dehydratase type I
LDLTCFKTEEIKKLFSQHNKLIATHRPDKHSDEERMKNLKTAIKAGAKYLDLEYESNENYRKELISFAHGNNCDVIISYHNYKFTPDSEVLKIILKNCFDFGADIAKIVTTAITNIDNSKILSLYNYPGRIIAFCMGNMGKITRIIAPFMGAEFTYAAMDEGEATAAGQIKYSDIRSIIQKIEKSID